VSTQFPVNDTAIDVGEIVACVKLYDLIKVLDRPPVLAQLVVSKATEEVRVEVSIVQVDRITQFAYSLFVFAAVEIIHSREIGQTSAGMGGSIARAANKEYCNQRNNHASYSQAYGYGENLNFPAVLDKIFDYKSFITSQDKAAKNGLPLLDFIIGHGLNGE